MGYTSLMFLVTLIFAPLAIIGAGLLYGVARSLGAIPGGRGPGIVGALLCLCSGYGALYLYATVDQLVAMPERLQRQYLGDEVVGPTQLVGYEAGGFQDPYQIWRYSLSQVQTAALLPRCRWNGGSDGRGVCTLFSGMDGRWAASVTLDRDELVMVDGLH